MNTNKEREPGYYWVKYENEWQVLRWVEYGWLVHGEDYFINSMVEEIDERRIERKPIDNRGFNFSALEKIEDSKFKRTPYAAPFINEVIDHSKHNRASLGDEVDGSERGFRERNYFDSTH